LFQSQSAGHLPDRGYLFSRDFITGGVSELKTQANGSVKHTGSQPQNNMKTRTLITIGAVALAAVVINVSAYNLTLTPRAASIQQNVVKSAAELPAYTVNYVASATPALLTPRAAANQIKVVAGIGQAVPVAKCSLVGTPKAISLAGSQARMSCCGMMVASCPMNANCGK
jgi:hypothetical protein